MDLLGIDLSMTSPALCHFSGDAHEEFNIAQCEFFFLTQREKFLYGHKQLHGELFLEYNCDSERYDNIAQWVVDICTSKGIQKAFIEGYSMGSVGRVFNIAENTGILKHQLWKKHIECVAVAPTTVKKFATGSGRADKNQMQVAFIKETGMDIKKHLNMTDKQWNPSSDIIDSYYICKHGHHNQNKL